VGENTGGKRHLLERDIIFLRVGPLASSPSKRTVTFLGLELIQNFIILVKTRTGQNNIGVLIGMKLLENNLGSIL
jgi:hypothetical protein